MSLFKGRQPISPFGLIFLQLFILILIIEDVFIYTYIRKLHVFTHFPSDFTMQKRPNSATCVLSYDSVHLMYFHVKQMINFKGLQHLVEISVFS